MPRTRTTAPPTTTTTTTTQVVPQPLRYNNNMTRRLRVVMYNAMDFEREAFESVLDEIPLNTTTTTTQGATASDGGGGEMAAADLSLSIPEMTYVDARLSPGTVTLSRGCDVVSLYVTDQGDSPILQKLSSLGVGYISERYSGFANVDRDVAANLGFKLSSSPITHCSVSIAEYTITLILTLTKRLIPAVQRYASNHCILPDIFGNDLSTRTVGVVGTGETGREVIRWLSAFDCTVLAFDTEENPALSAITRNAAEDHTNTNINTNTSNSNIENSNSNIDNSNSNSNSNSSVHYVSFDTLLSQSHIITLHAPLVPATVHMIDSRAIARCRRGVTIINTARGALVHNPSIIQALHSGQVGAFGADCLEGESDLLFDDSSLDIKASKHIDELTTMNNVLITIHQGQTTLTAASKVARETFNTLREFQLLMAAKEAQNNPINTIINSNSAATPAPAVGRTEKIRDDASR